MADTLAAVRKEPLEEGGHLYLVDAHGGLVGQVPIEALLTADPDAVVSTLQGPPPVTVQLRDSAESVALMAVEQHDGNVAVVDRRGRLRGAVPIGRLLAVLHKEHTDDILRMGGVMPNHPTSLWRIGIAASFRARIPWLLMGLLGGFLAGSIASFFEHSLKEEIALAFFLPLVVYMADAIGTQTETILIRALAYEQVSIGQFLFQEGAIGMVIGSIIGGLAGVSVLIWSSSAPLAGVIALTLVLTSLVATLVAGMLPLALSHLGADPALASGPIATVVQDILSVAIYLSIATLILS